MPSLDDTGMPKGVMISHRNMVAALSGVCNGIPEMGPGDYYVAYLPLAHILELCAECGLISRGPVHPLTHLMTHARDETCG